MRVVFFGTPEFSAFILNYLLEHSVNVVAVVSRPDKPRGRSGSNQPTAVKETAQRAKLPIYQPEKASDGKFAELLKSLNADLFVVVAYAEILRENILEIPRLGCINVHGSALPKYRGAAPVQRAIMAGEKETAVSIMKMVREMDAGDIYAMEKIAISDYMTAGELFDEMAKVGAKTLLGVIKSLENGKAKSFAQDASQVTFANKIKQEDREIKWTSSAEKIHNHIRGITPNPGAYCFAKINGEVKRINIKKTAVLPNSDNLPPGMVIHGDPKKLIVACEEGAIQILELQLEGKKVLTAEDFLRGINISDFLFT